MADSYEKWLGDVKAALRSINMPFDDWQNRWSFNFQQEFKAGVKADDAAMKANRYWWREQNKSLKQDCRKMIDCWLPRGHQGDCQPVSMPTYQRGDFVKVEFPGDAGMPSEWMWVRVRRSDDDKKLVFGILDNEPINDYDGELELGTELAVSYDKVREHRRAGDSTGTHPYSGTNETHMNAENMKSLNAGDTLVYNDGRPGHIGVKAVVLSNHENCVVVQFEDRADTTTIKHGDVGWTKYLKLEYPPGIA